MGRASVLVAASFTSACTPCVVCVCTARAASPACKGLALLSGAGNLSSGAGHVGLTA